MVEVPKALSSFDLVDMEAEYLKKIADQNAIPFEAYKLGWDYIGDGRAKTKPTLIEQDELSKKIAEQLRCYLKNC